MSQRPGLHRCRPALARPRHAAGTGLIEVMVAMTIALLLTAGAVATFDHTVFIPTFVPLEREPEGDAAACTQAIGYNNLYQVSVLDARPGQHLGQSGHEVVAGGLAIRLGQAGIAPEPVFLFPATPAAPADGGPAGDAAPPAPERPPPVCLIGAESCGSLAGVAPRRTYWRKQGSE